MQGLLYSTILGGATFLWGYLFYKQDFHPQPLRKIWQIFGIGLFSVLPVFAYKYVYQHYLPMLSEVAILRPLTESAFLEGVLFFVFNMVVLSGLLFLFAGTLTTLLTFLKHETLSNIRGAIKDEELEFVTVSVMLGLLVMLERAVENWTGSSVIGTALGLVLFLAVIEEYVKHLTVRFVDDKKIKDVDDAITFSVMVGLAFSLIETIIYAINGAGMGGVFYRALLSTPVHLVASGIFGYYYGLAHFGGFAPKKSAWRINLKWLHKTLTLNRATVYEEEKMIEGLFFATLFHSACNLLFEFGLAFLVVPVLVGGLFTLSFLYKKGHALQRFLGPANWRLKQTER